ncbi:MAG: helix-turn-helix transcriptional regulator [Thermonemataceae bacterium]
MHVFHLPQALINEKDIAQDVIFYHYQQQQPTRAKVLSDWHIVTFIEKGEKELFWKNQYHTFTSGQAAIIRSGHGIMLERHTVAQAYQSKILLFSSALLSDFMQKYAAYFQKVAPSPMPSAVYPFTITPYLHTLLDTLSLLQKHQPNDAMYRLKIEELLLYLLQSKDKQQVLAFLWSLQDHSPAINFKRVIEEHINHHLTVEELAFICHMSVSTFKRRFQQLYGTSPQKWFRTQKLKMAAHWLSHSSKKVSDIYETLGYENLSSFIQAFKLQYGVTPKQYQTKD